ncbi:MAG: hypothetical protein FIB02_11450 [Desulfuromonas sp.]|nr:hypothetical protein [Desulfuromonas sp.]
MNPLKSLRRHPFLVLTGLVLTGAALWIGYFLSTFDLNQYRDHLAETVGDQLQLPVHLGAAHLELREAGIAFSFSDLHIGTEQTPVELQAEKIWLQLAWRGLLLKMPIISEISLKAPRLRITRQPNRPADDNVPDERFTLDLLQDLQIHRVEARQGSLTIDWFDRAGQRRELAIDDISAEIDDFGLARTVTLDATAHLPRHSGQARLAINGSIALPATGELHNANADLVLDARSLDAALLAELFADQTGASATGEADLSMHLKGNPAGSVTVQADLSGKRLNLITGNKSGKPFPIKHLQLAGTWQKQEDRHSFRQVEIKLDDLGLAGEFSVTSGDNGHQITGQLNNSILPLDTLRQWVPPALVMANPLLARRLPGGLPALNTVRFHADIPEEPQKFVSFSLEEFHGEAKNLGWDLGAERKVEFSSLLIRFEDNRWSLEQGTGMLAGLPVVLSGTLVPTADGPSKITLDATFSGTAEQLSALGTTLPPADLAVVGPLMVKVHLDGTPQQYSLDVSLDLSGLDLRYGNEFHLAPTPGAVFIAQAQGNGNALTIEQSSLTLPPFTGSLTGNVDWTEAPLANLAARIELADLTAAYDLAPVLSTLKLAGGVLLNLTMTGPLTALDRQASLELRDVGVPAHGIVADITQINGRLLLDGKGVRSEKLTARLGKSPVILRARVTDLGSPRLELGVKAAAIRADELIFRSDRSFLREIDGRLIFDRDGLQFAPVKVRLDGGTRATVSGSVKNFASPQVDLDITGDYANVEEIIGLWTNESPAAEKIRLAHHAEVPHAPLPPIRIKVDAREGDLYSMKFAKARALIVPTSERLLIHPLDFNVGDGYCTTQVLVDYAGQHPVLRVSGHAENVDAYEVVNELLNRKSIMRGSLRGDFYLQGELGEGRFLPTSFGNINVAVRDGVMRHSPVLSTVFSLLNVSQLFSFKLPDVNSEGVPFTRLSAELAIDKGVLSSDLIVIDSEAMNMSYVGKYDMVRDRLDLLVVVKPLGTIDRVVTSLPIAGWILGGEEHALITAQFRVTGPGADPEIEAIPISALSKGVLGIFQRTLSLPLKLVDDPAILWGGGGEKK